MEFNSGFKGLNVEKEGRSFRYSKRFAEKCWVKHEILQNTSFWLLDARCVPPEYDREVQGDSLARGPKLVYLQIFNESVNKVTDDELTTGYYRQDGATCHTSNASMQEIKSLLKTLLSKKKTFGHPDLPI